MSEGESDELCRQLDAARIEIDRLRETLLTLMSNLARTRAPDLKSHRLASFHLTSLAEIPKALDFVAEIARQAWNAQPPLEGPIELRLIAWEQEPTVIPRR